MESVGKAGLSGCYSFPVFHVINILVLVLNIDQISLEENIHMLNKYYGLFSVKSIYIYRENYKQEAQTEISII